MAMISLKECSEQREASVVLCDVAAAWCLACGQGAVLGQGAAGFQCACSGRILVLGFWFQLCCRGVLLAKLGSPEVCVECGQSVSEPLYAFLKAKVIISFQKKKRPQPNTAYTLLIPGTGLTAYAAE
jgi:DNA-directed RNA polymerase subunit RPC12/RpoP